MTDEILESREMPESEQEQVKEKIIDMDEKKMKFYEDLRAKAKAWSQKGGKSGNKLAEYLFLLPDFFMLLARLAVDKRVPNKTKLMAGGIIAYVMMPLDLIPDFIPIIGHVDDLVLVVLGLNMILNGIDQKILTDNWSGEGDLLEHMQAITATAEKFLDKNLLSKIKAWLRK
ncbi:MAG TPA: YkvA family protein [Candidatus Cloacimonadota bacterium]|nr:YkvA family protein [Candidatus Cloacimonadota bacterium]HPS38173.1 YkvA family protein [Candidatus Cloacimonadota bacterium]